MTRGEVIEAMAKALYECDPIADKTGAPMSWADFSERDLYGTVNNMRDDCRAALAAIEAAGVRLVPVNEKPGQGWLHEAVKDACLRASKTSGGTPPQLLYAPILWAMQDALAASPYAPKETNNGT